MFVGLRKMIHCIMLVKLNLEKSDKIIFNKYEYIVLNIKT